MTPGPLWGRAPLRLLREGPWAALVVASFALCAAAAAADVLSVSAWRTASVDRVLDSVADSAGPRDAPAVRVSATPGPGRELDALRRTADAVPGLADTRLLGVSFADELLGTRLVRYEGFAAAGGRRVPARLTAVDDPAAVLTVVTPAAGPEAAGPAAAGPAAAGPPEPGVWVPEVLATSLGVAVGDRLEVGSAVSRRGETSTGTVVVGTYEAGAGSVPVDLPGSTFWRTRAGRLPGDTGGLADPSVLVGDPATVALLAVQIDDVLIWSLDAAVDPPRPSRDALQATVAGVGDLRRAVAAIPPPDEESELPTSLVSGLEDLAEAADAITARAAAEARTPAVGAVVLGLALVLAVSVLTASRRSQELELVAGLGVRPPAVGLLAVVEVLPAALLGLAVGGPTAWLLVRTLAGGAPGPGSSDLAAAQTGAVVGAGVLLHGAVMGLAAAGAARRGTRHHRPGRTLPWRPVLLVTTVAAVAGLVAAPVGGARGLDLSVPVLLSAAAGATGATVLRGLADRRPSGGGSARGSAAGASGGGPGLGPMSTRTAGALVVRRRLGAAGSERLLVVTALATAFGLAAHVLVGGELVARSVQDKAAVLSGAEVVVELDQAGQVDPDLPAEGFPREVAVAAGDTVVFRDSGRLPGDRSVDVVVVDLATFAGVASWGSPGGPLDRVRAQLDVLGRADVVARPPCPSLPLGPRGLPSQEQPEPPSADCPPGPDGVAPGRLAAGPAPVLVVGETAGLRPGSRVRLASAEGDVLLVVAGLVEAFPGVDPDLRTGLVGATGSYLPRLPGGDPRLTPLTDGVGPVSTDLDGVELWSRRPLADVVAGLPTAGVSAAEQADGRRVRTAGTALARPAFVAVDLVAPYLRVLAVLVLLVALLALCLAVDRATARARPGDLVLARVGFGRAGTRRLLTAEAAVLVLTGLGLGALGWVLTLPLLPRLLEPDPSVGPLLDPVAVPWSGAVLAGAALLALGAAALVVRVGSRASSEEEVLRGQG